MYLLLGTLYRFPPPYPHIHKPTTTTGILKITKVYSLICFVSFFWVAFCTLPFYLVLEHFAQLHITATPSQPLSGAALCREMHILRQLK